MQNDSRDPRREELCHGCVDHLLRHFGVKAMGARKHLGRDECGAEDAGGKPQSDILCCVSCGLVYPMRLNCASDQRNNRRGRESQRAVAAELGSLRHLTANAAYINERSVEIGHELNTLTRRAYTLECKV